MPRDKEGRLTRDLTESDVKLEFYVEFKDGENGQEWNEEKFRWEPIEHLEGSEEENSKERWVAVMLLL